MDGISLPTSMHIMPHTADVNRATMTVSPCYPGYGTTLGNALRRVLLSSLPGAAVVAFKVKGVDHEFSTIPGIREDVVEMILNIKSLRFQMDSEEPIELELIAKGEGLVTASKFKKKTGVIVANPDAVIATITDKTGEMNLRVLVKCGRGYVPVETREKEKLDVGYIALDSIFTPVRNVNFHVEHMRVGQMTNFDKLIMDIATDGTMPPESAFRSAAQILVEQFQGLLVVGNDDVLENEEEVVDADDDTEKDKKEESEEETEE